MTARPFRPNVFMVSAFAALALGALAACDRGGNKLESMIIPEGQIASSPAPMMRGEMDFAGAEDNARSMPDGAPLAQEGMLLAYSYAVSFELPVRNVAALKDMHEAACRAAGPQLCLVLGGAVGGDGEQYAYGNLSIRAEPRWLETFRAGLAEDAANANGRISNESTSTEDLTRSIVDVEARLAAQETLRERLLILLERPTDEVDDLLAAERELARVQGDIDSARSQLAVMRARVNMSRLDLNYEAIPPAVSRGAFAPVAAALRDFLSTLAESLAVVITIIAAAIPFVVILISLIILVVKFFRRWRSRRRAAKAA